MKESPGLSSTSPTSSHANGAAPWSEEDNADGRQVAHPSSSQNETLYILGNLAYDRTEVNVRAYRGCIQAKECELPAPFPEEAMWGCNLNVQDDSKDQLEHPMNCLEQKEAEKFCAYKKGRLPTANEWLLLAQGQEAKLLRYGVSETWPFEKESDSKKLFGNFADVSAVKQRPFWTALVLKSGEVYEDGVSNTSPVQMFEGPSGVYNLFGNVSEWTSTHGKSKQYARVMGASFGSSEESQFDLKKEKFVHKKRASMHIGFRCVYKK